MYHSTHQLCTSHLILNCCCSELWVSYETRRAAAKKMRKDTIQAITNNFNANLSKRGFTGSLAMNKDDRTLTLEVNSTSSTPGPYSQPCICGTFTSLTLLRL